MAYTRRSADRELGAWRGQVWVAPDFDETDDETIQLFEDGE